MNISQLFYFLEIVASDFNISMAAEKVHVSQSTMSKSILNFEESEQVQLFTRHGKRITGLTNAGDTFYHDAKKVIRDYDHMMTHVHSKETLAGKVTVGIASAVLVSHFSSILPKFRLEHPNIKIEVHDQGGEVLQQQLLLERIDLAYVVAPLRYDSLDRVNLITDCGAIVFNPELINVNTSITLKELSKLPMVLLSTTFNIRDQLDTLFGYEHVSPNVIMESASESFLLHACRTQPLITILPRAILKGYQTSGLSVIPLKQLNWELLSTKSKKNDNPLVDEVRKIFDAEIKEIG